MSKSILLMRHLWILQDLQSFIKKNYYKLALELKDRIANEAGIPVSIGVSRTKTLAKLASDKSKSTRDRIWIAGKASIRELLEKTEIQEVWGIGRKLGVKLRGHGIRTAYDYVQKDDKWIKTRFGKNGLTIKAELLGVVVSP